MGYDAGSGHTAQAAGAEGHHPDCRGAACGRPAETPQDPQEAHLLLDLSHRGWTGEPTE